MIPAHPLIHLAPCMLAALFPFALGILVRIRNQAPVGRTLSAMLFVQAFWSAVSLMEIVFGSLEGKISWDDLQYLAVGTAAVIALSFSLRYEGSWFKGGRRTWLFLKAFPIAACILAASSPLHGLHRADARIDQTVPFGELLYTFRMPMLVLIIPLYGISLAGILRLSRYATRLRGPRKMELPNSGGTGTLSLQNCRFGKRLASLRPAGCGGRAWSLAWPTDWLIWNKPRGDSRRDALPPLS